MPAGRPTKYKDEYCEQVFKLCLLGASDKEIAGFFEVSESTLNKWKLDHPIFSESIKKGKIDADVEIANSLYHSAKGYELKEEKKMLVDGVLETKTVTKKLPPEYRAIRFWLMNRHPEKWRDKQGMDVDGDLTIRIVRE